MASPVSVVVVRPPPLWPAMIARGQVLRRAFGAPAVVVEGEMIDSPFGPRIAAHVDLPLAMVQEPPSSHPVYRAAMRDAAGMIGFARMAALGASGIDAVAAAGPEPQRARWQLVLVPAGVVLIVRTDDADFGPFLLAEEGAPDGRDCRLAACQIEFAGITVGGSSPVQTAAGRS